MREKSQMELLIDLLFVPNGEKREIYKTIFSDDFNWDDFLKLILQNGIFCRTYSIINGFAKNNNCNFSFPQSFKNALEKEKDKQRAFLEGIIFIQKAFRKHKINMVVLKSFDKYPDTGGDIDIYVGKEIKRASQVLIKNGMTRNPSSYLKLFNRYYLVSENLKIPKKQVDLYYKLTRYYEEWLPDSNILLSHKRIVNISNAKVNVTSPEDTILVHCISSIYLNASVDLSSVWVVHKQINNGNFDLNYFITIINEAGISLGMYYLLYLTKEVTRDEKVIQIMENIFVSPFLKRILIKRLNPSFFPSFISYSHIFLLYFHKIFSDIVRKKVTYLIFLIIPLIASLIIRKKTYRGINEQAEKKIDMLDRH